jgi:hypothetical protein
MDAGRDIGGDVTFRPSTTPSTRDAGFERFRDHHAHLIKRDQGGIHGLRPTTLRHLLGTQKGRDTGGTYPTQDGGLDIAGVRRVLRPEDLRPPLSNVI